MDIQTWKTAGECQSLSARQARVLVTRRPLWRALGKPQTSICFHIGAWMLGIGWYQRVKAPFHKNFTQLCIVCLIVWLGNSDQSEGRKSTRLENRMMSGKIDGRRQEEFFRLPGTGVGREGRLFSFTRPSAAPSIDCLWLFSPPRNIFLMQLDLTYWSGSSRWPQAVCVRVEYIFNMFDFIALKDEKKNPCEGHSKQQQSALV